MFLHIRKKILNSKALYLGLSLLFQLAVLVFLLTYFSHEFVPVYYCMIVLSIAVSIYIINRNSDSSSKLLWVFVIMALPFFGGLMYLLFGERKIPKALQVKERQNQSEYQKNQKQSDAILQQEDDPLLHKMTSMALHDGYFSLYDNSSVQYFPNGQDQFAKLVKVLKNARSSIFIETYILDKGYMWDTIRQILVEKSAQGVDVRLIYDDFGSMLNIEENYPETLQQLGIQTRTFNPMTPTLAVSMNNRDHRKTIIVDSMYAFTGGSNIADEYINKKERFGYWKDMGAMVMGKGVEPFIISFLQMWNYGIDQPTPYAPFLKNPALFSQLHEPGYVIPFFDSPTDHNNVGRDFHMNMLIQAKETFWISTPYLVLDDEMIATFELAVKNGVDVRVIIPGIPDKKMVYAVSLANAQILTSKGVKVYTYTPGFNHGKVAISDHTHALTGTVNMDFRSYFQNYECGVWMYKVPAIADIEKDFEQMFADSKLLTKEDFASTKPLVRLYRDTLKIFSPLL